MGCNVLRGPRPAAWDQEPPFTEEGLPDADWSTTKLYTLYPLSDKLGS